MKPSRRTSPNHKSASPPPEKPDQNDDPLWEETTWPKKEDTAGWARRALELWKENKNLSHKLRATQREIAEQEHADPALQAMRANLIREMATLLPVAVARARSKNGSPALLRLITRSLKTL